MADVVYTRHRPVEQFEFRSPNGMVGRWTTKKAKEAATLAIGAAPKPGQGEGYATGELALDIRPERATVGRSGPESRVISATEHAVFVHEGTPPHVIRPRRAKKLVFFWRKAGRVVYAKSVRHPGTQGNPYLVKALRQLFGGPGR